MLYTQIQQGKTIAYCFFNTVIRDDYGYEAAPLLNSCNCKHFDLDENGILATDSLQNNKLWRSIKKILGYDKNKNNS
jgi:hypothetical protein